MHCVLGKQAPHWKISHPHTTLNLKGPRGTKTKGVTPPRSCAALLCHGLSGRSTKMLARSTCKCNAFLCGGRKRVAGYCCKTPTPSWCRNPNQLSRRIREFCSFPSTDDLAKTCLNLSFTSKEASTHKMWVLSPLKSRKGRMGGKN